MPTVHTLSEVGLIARLARHLARRSPRAPRGGWRVQVGIGDDAAVLRLPAPRRRTQALARQAGLPAPRRQAEQLLLFASDMLVEGVHFERRRVPARWIGWKALACNVSDIAAMGGRPLAAVISLGLPATTSVRFVDALYEGLARCARRFGMAVVGGDTVRAPQVVIDVAILGAVRPTHLTLRSGVRVGDRLFVTGQLGGSLRSGWHARFLPRVEEAQRLVRRVKVHAMMDLSDGLAADLWQMSRASRMALRVRRSSIPVSSASHSVEEALMNGEDFELLFAVASRAAARVPRRLGSTPVTPIGAVVGRGVRVEQEYPDGRIRPLLPTGFHHF